MVDIFVMTKLYLKIFKNPISRSSFILFIFFYIGKFYIAFNASNYEVLECLCVGLEILVHKFSRSNNNLELLN